MRTFELSESGHKHTFPVKSHIHAEHTGFQNLEILELESLGKTLVLDNIIQLSELDDAKYHEAMAHPVIASLECAKKSLVIGGGDGCLIRELLKHKDLDISLVEIDERVINASHRHLSDLNNFSFSNSRCTIHIADACSWIASCNDKFDAIFLDITDPQHNTPSANIITDETMLLLAERVSSSGMLVTQSDNPDICPEQTDLWVSALSRHFKKIQVYGIPCLSYGSAINFVVATNGDGILIDTPLIPGLNWLNEDRLRAAFSLYGVQNVQVD